MYVPSAFAVDDLGELHDIIEAVAVAHVVSPTANGMVASFVPLVLDRDAGELGVLRGHLARANRHWRDATDGDSLAIFTGPDAYVSPNWYPSKAIDGKQLPTWNYEVIHVTGRLVIHDDVDWLERLVRDLTERHESPRPDPWSVDDAPADYVTAMLRAVVGIEMTIDAIEGKRKLSQNRNAADREGAIAGLSTGNERQRAVAAAMRAARDR